MAKGILYEKEEPRPGSSQPRRTFSPGRCTNLAHAMALAFLGDPPVDKKATEAATERGDPKIVYCSADHIDTDYLNDVLHNIRWATAEEQRPTRNACLRRRAEHGRAFASRLSMEAGKQLLQPRSGHRR